MFRINLDAIQLGREIYARSPCGMTNFRRTLQTWSSAVFAIPPTSSPGTGIYAIPINNLRHPYQGNRCELFRGVHREKRGTSYSIFERSLILNFRRFNLHLVNFSSQNSTFFEIWELFVHFKHRGYNA